jgi:hypothetical protein
VTTAAPPSVRYDWDEAARSRLVDELRQALDRLPDATMALFSGPAPSTDDAAARQDLAVAVAGRAGLAPWPEWAAVRHGRGLGAHVLNVIDELGETGRARGVVVALLAPIDSCLVAQMGVVAAERGLDVAVVGGPVTA